jgi:DNA/RNA endonuclease YhcR with UshA esterase domain
MNRLALAITAIVIGSVAAWQARAEEPKKNDDAATSRPATVSDVIDVKEAATKLKDKEGVTVSVRGKVKEVFTGKSGVVILNFDGINRRDFNVVIKKENADTAKAGFNGDLDAALKGHTITVTGPVSRYRNNPQIDVSKPEQINVEADAEKKE